MFSDVLSPELQKNLNRYFPYLMEVRKRLLFIASTFLISGIFGFFYYEKIIIVILNILDLTGVNVVFTSPFQYFSLAINSGFLVGLVVAFPLILYQVLSFIKPALSEKEFKLLVLLTPFAVLLFVFGFLFGVSIMKYVLDIFYEKSIALEIGNLLDINLLLSKIILTGVLMGIAFQFPIIMTALMRVRVVHYKDFVKQRTVAYGVSILFAALLPPTDVLSLVLLTLPLVMLFEITLLLNRFVLKAHLFESR